MKRVMRRQVLVAVAFLAVGLCAFGCGRGSGTNDSGASTATADETAHIDNCSLVTDSEATTLAGRELQHEEDSLLGCPYVRPGRNMSEFTVRAFTGKGPAKDHLGEHSTDTVVHEISGVGDSAAVLARDQHVNFLIVQKGSRYVQFVTTFLEDMNLDSPMLKQAQDLAVKALGRIK